MKVIKEAGAEGVAVEQEQGGTEAELQEEKQSSKEVKGAGVEEAAAEREEKKAEELKKEKPPRKPGSVYRFFNQFGIGKYWEKLNDYYEWEEKMEKSTSAERATRETVGGVKSAAEDQVGELKATAEKAPAQVQEVAGRAGMEAGEAASVAEAVKKETGEVAREAERAQAELSEEVAVVEERPYEESLREELRDATTEEIQQRIQKIETQLLAPESDEETRAWLEEEKTILIKIQKEKSELPGETIQREAAAYFEAQLSALEAAGTEFAGGRERYQAQMEAYRDYISKGKYFDELSFRFEQDGKIVEGKEKSPYDFLVGALGKYENLQKMTEDQKVKDVYGRRAESVGKILQAMAKILRRREGPPPSESAGPQVLEIEEEKIDQEIEGELKAREEKPSVGETGEAPAGLSGKEEEEWFERGEKTEKRVEKKRKEIRAKYKAMKEKRKKKEEMSEEEKIAA